MLNPKVIDRVFARLLVRYGAQWLRQWEGVDMDAVKAEWANELGGYANNLNAIGYGLDNLPQDFPPNVAQFKAICNRRPEPATLAIEPPPVNPAVAKKALDSFAGAGLETPAEWMGRLDREVRAGNASRSRIEHHRIATANGYYGGSSSAVGGDFTPIRPEVLPHGMRAAQ